MTGGVSIGEFEITSGRIVLTDPCYDKGTGGMIEDLTAKNGTWLAYTRHSNEEEWGKRVSELYAVHSEISDLFDCPGTVDALERDAEPLDGIVGVDSGQAGIFDQERYPEDPREHGYEENFYKVICDMTYDEKTKELKGGTIGFGCASSSGFGDGGYDAFGTKIDGELVFVKIVFLERK